MTGLHRSVSGLPVWLALEPDPVLAFLHEPANEHPERPMAPTAVLVCPPFGLEEMWSYRRRRAWAESLAQRGFPAARIALPGTGDSGGSPADPGRLGAWTHAVSAAAEWLRETTGAARVASIGIGLGGMLACRAVAQGAVIDDLILWAVPAHGRVLLRELRAYAGIVAAHHPADGQVESPPGGDLQLTGFLLSAETARDLESLRITDLEVPHANRRRVLLLGRDGFAVDERLRDHFERAGAAVTVDAAGEYRALMAQPQEPYAPRATIAKSLSWLTEGMADAPARPAGVNRLLPAARSSVEFPYEGTTICETPLRLDGALGKIFGILTENADSPPALVCAVLLNAGALCRVGPNRAWVEIARRWAARGVPTVRLDLEGIGDSEGDERELVTDHGLYISQRTESTVAILDQLATCGLPNRFLLGGLCSGAYWSLQAALADTRVVGVLMINLYSFIHSEALVAERQAPRPFQALEGNAWRSLLRREFTRRHVKVAIDSLRPARIRTAATHPVERALRAQLEGTLDRIRDQGAQALLMLSQGEPLHDQLVRDRVFDRLERWPNLSIEQIPSRDHMFRALWLQRHVHTSVDRMLERVLEAAVAVQPAQSR